jgi:hypothetical protein
MRSPTRDLKLEPDPVVVRGGYGRAASEKLRSIDIERAMDRERGGDIDIANWSVLGIAIVGPVRMGYDCGRKASHPYSKADLTALTESVMANIDCSCVLYVRHHNLGCRPVPVYSVEVMAALYQHFTYYSRVTPLIV